MLIVRRPGTRSYQVIEEDYRMDVYVGPFGRRFIYVFRGVDTEAYYRVARTENGFRVEERHPRSDDFSPTKVYPSMTEVIKAVETAHGPRP